MWAETQDMEGCPQPKEAVDAREFMGDCPLLGTPCKRKGYKTNQPKILGGYNTYAWPVLSAPSRCLLLVTTGKRRPGAAECSESIKLLLCSPAECEHRILTVTALCHSLGC